MSETKPTGEPIETAGEAENVGFSEFTKNRLNVWKGNIDRRVYDMVTADYRNRDNYAQTVDTNVKLPFTGELVSEMSETWSGGSRVTIVDKDGKVKVTLEETDGSLRIKTADKKDYKGREALFQEIVCGFARTWVGHNYLLDGEDTFFKAAGGYSLDKSGSAWFRASFYVSNIDGEKIVHRYLFAHDDQQLETSGTHQKIWVTRDTNDSGGVVRAGLVIHKEGEFALPQMEVVGQKAE